MSQHVFSVSVYGKPYKFQIQSITTDSNLPVAKVVTSTTISFPEPNKVQTGSPAELDMDIGYNAIGGLQQQVRTVREMVEMAFHDSSLLSHYGTTKYKQHEWVKFHNMTFSKPLIMLKFNSIDFLV